MTRQAGPSRSFEGRAVLVTGGSRGSGPRSRAGWPVRGPWSSSPTTVTTRRPVRWPTTSWETAGRPCGTPGRLEARPLRRGVRRGRCRAGRRGRRRAGRPRRQRRGVHQRPDRANQHQGVGSRVRGQRPWSVPHGAARRAAAARRGADPHDLHDRYRVAQPGRGGLHGQGGGRVGHRGAPRELGHRGITANTISLGPTQTDLLTAAHRRRRSRRRRR